MQVEINIDEKEKNYKVFIDELEKIKVNGRAVILSNKTVAPLHLDFLLAKIEDTKVDTIIIEDGEKYKNFETINYILEQMFELMLDRKTTLITLGGGVVGDMGGFVASIFQRGIDFIQVPTTLLAQVDASVGGKTGINNKYGKNLVGAFHQPVAVYCNSSFLETLPSREFSAGVAEIIKMAVMFDIDFFRYLQENDIRKDKKSLKYAIQKCVEIKADVVSLDEKENGIRSVLNYGHTFGHVVENITNYDTYLHGEAVSLGMVMANNLAFELGLINESENEDIKSILKFYNLPTIFEVKNKNDFYEHFSLDKKSFNGRIKFILPKGIGNFKIVDDIEEDIVKGIL